jgi:hypothetical protein
MLPMSASASQRQQLIMEENVFIETLLGKGTVTRMMSAEEMAAYNEPFPTAQSRFPIFVWPNELPIAGEPARNVNVIETIGEWLKVSDTPARRAESRSARGTTRWVAVDEEHRIALALLYVVDRRAVHGHELRVERETRRWCLRWRAGQGRLCRGVGHG